MRFRTLLTINAIVALVYAVGLLLAPTALLALYGMTSGPSEQLMARFFGVALVSVGLLTWFARNITDPNTYRAFIVSQLIANVVGLIVSILGTLSSVMNVMGWSAVAIYLLLGLGYAYFQFMKPSAASRHVQ